MAKTAKYDEAAVKTLSSLEHIRLRTGMYIGRLGNGSNPDDGVYILIKEIIDNSIDEYIMGRGRRIIMRVKDRQVKIRDYGRGIPLGKLTECVSIINTGAKYNNEVFQFSVGLNGVGSKAVNALSSDFRVVSFRQKRFAEAVFKQGVLVSRRQGASQENDGLYVEFTPDLAVFGDYEFNHGFIEQRLRNYAYLNNGLTITFNRQNFNSKNGLFDFLENEVGDQKLYEICHCRGDKIEFALTHTGAYGENLFSFVNGQYTADGGTHQSAFREGILKGANELYQKTYNGVDVREGIAGVIAIKIQDPLFESQTKNKLGNSEIRSWIINEVKAALVDFFHKNQAAAKVLEEKIISNQKLRTELNTVRKEAREAARKIALKIPNLKDCKYHLPQKKGEESTIFITEGQSAAGSMVASREINTQAIFSLKGKPQNVYGKGKASIYKNEELYNLMMALGIENDLGQLRYARIVIATDADTDGFHIRNLLLTFFLNYFEELVVAGRLHILETPLFRVRDKKQTIYCYSEKEKQDAVKKLSQAEITRFKGLGEISPQEFGRFIGLQMRLSPVHLKTMKDVGHALAFYMGKNTPERREFIMANLA